MTTNRKEIAIGVYEVHDHVAGAALKMQRAGFNMQRVSIIGRDYLSEEFAAGPLGVIDRVSLFGKRGASWGSLTGLLPGSALVFIPAGKLVFILGTVAVAMSRERWGITLSDSASALAAIGFPGKTVARYETALRANRFILLVHGDELDIVRAHELLETTGLMSYKSHHIDEASPSYVHA